MNLGVDTIAIVLLGVAACVWDIRTRRIPNALTLGGAVAALAMQISIGGLDGGMTALGGWALGLVLFLPLFALGGMGAGDVKLLAAFGAWMGPWNTVQTALAAGVIGGVLALGLALSRNYMGQAFANMWSLLAFWRAAGLRPHPTLTLDAHAGPRLAYAIPISLGAIIVLWAQQ